MSGTAGRGMSYRWGMFLIYLAWLVAMVLIFWRASC